MNKQVIIYILGVLMLVLSGVMLATTIASYFITEHFDLALLYSMLITAASGFVCWKLGEGGDRTIHKREAFVIVTLSWFFLWFFCSLPYIFGNVFTNVTDAFFEGISGLTTTGASVMNDIEAVDGGILLWRSITQWLGGMGIIVLTVALLPLLGIGGVELFVAEAPGPTTDKIHPRIKETAKRIWLIYLGLTALLMVILRLEGMSIFDAINHAFTTMATGGFSTKNDSIAGFSPLIQYTITLFMFVAGVNYTIIYFGLNRKFQKVWKSDEFRAYLYFTLGVILFVAVTIFFVKDDITFEKSFRDAAFQVVSVITTTGFASADFTLWSPMLTCVFFMLLLSGASAGSTSGGIKMIRHLVLLKNIQLELKRLLHPKAIIRIKIDGSIVSPRVLTHIMVFFILYLLIFGIGTLVMVQVLQDFSSPLSTAASAVATAIGNVGPGVGELGPSNNFAAIPPFGKWFLMVLMIVGRLEIFTILMLFSPFYWRNN